MSTVATEEVQEREKWTHSAEFILSCLGYAVGLGNVWRFPYMCGQYGGAAFMIPYFILLLLAGLPVFYMELALGQYASLSPLILFKRMCPLFGGLGYAMVCIYCIHAIYYNMIMAWCFYYFAGSFSTTLPWAQCDNSWNDYKCRDPSCYNSTHISLKSACFLRSNLNVTISEFSNETLAQLDPKQEAMLNDFASDNDTILSTIIDIQQSPADQYFNMKVLKKSSSIEYIGPLKWDLVLCLFCAWVLVFLCLIKGIKSSGKVVYFTATFPYVILVILLLRGITLDGAIDGILFYVRPNATYLMQANVWGAAAGQIFFSLSLGAGGLTTLASYNRFHNNMFRDTLIVVFGNSATSIFAGFVIFSIIGFMAKQTGRSVADISAGGPGLAFIAYPEALSRLPVSQFWAVLFFFMLIILAIDTMIVIVEVVITAIVDQWPFLRVWKKKVLVVAAVCSTFFLCGLLLCTPGGSYIISVCDKYAGGWVLIISGLFEICMVSWIYGIKQFVDDIKFMLGVPKNRFYKILGFPVNLYWIVCWAAVTPVLLVSILIFNWVDHERKVDGEYIYPYEADIAGWLLTMFCIGWIPLVAIYHLIKTKIQGRRLADLIEPTKDWGPYEVETQSQKHHVTQNEWRHNQVICETSDQSGCSNPVAALQQEQPAITCRRCNMLTPHYAYENDLVKESTRM